MPRIHDDYTNCAVYIYRSLQDAESGERYGGSGFLCSVKLAANPDWCDVYVVTNRHVVEKAKTPVIRLNRVDGNVEYVQTTVDNWLLHPDADDIAVLPFDTEFQELKTRPIDLGLFVTPQLVSEEDIGIGDDTVMIGRFVNHEGTQKNSPAVRFGNIAMMNHESIVTPSGFEQEAFLVEIRSLPGYSGSAVFIYSPCAMNDMSTRRQGKTQKEDEEEREKERAAKGSVLMGFPERFMSPKGPYLLGIDFCHLQRNAEVRMFNGSPTSEHWYVEENTGMAGVIPAWKIAELLNAEELVKLREKSDAAVTLRKERSGVSLDSAGEDDRKTFTKEDFESALTKVTRKVAPTVKK